MNPPEPQSPPECVGKPTAWWVPYDRHDKAIGLALAYCARCACRAWCAATATEDDWQWSIRAGQLPRWMRRNP